MHQPTTAFFTPEDKQRHPYLSSVLELNTQKVIATAAVRVYYAPFINPHLNWTYSKLKGILVFGRDREGLGSLAGVPSQLLSPPPDRGGAQGHGLRLKEKYWFRLIDVKTDRVVWMFSVPEVFEYCKDKPFFHYFTGTTRMFGFCFDEDEEADVFFKKVADRTRRHFFGAFRQRVNSTKKQAKATNLNPLKSKNKSKSLPASANQPPIRPSTTTPLKPCMISGPSPHSFVHVSHVGISANGGIESSKNVEPAWSALIADLQGYGFESEGELVSEAGHGGNGANADFMEGFLAGAKAVKDRVVGASTAAEAALRSKTSLTFASPTSAPTSPPTITRALSPAPPLSPPARTLPPILSTGSAPVSAPEPATTIRSPSPTPESPPPEKKRKIRRRVL
ncbi:hypothetical protein F5J12DRAFT_784753 [Pisolithus orientalis]|uniref:uncharacterized protein n=1 Tax=Pisolithus orientalis TaxID=936130 RepID=UPI0022243AA6|nr:uncharacterized protein F5J12DRAFT_784753 [Pisolithus orientalis]KAI5998899.1 hypothetical protein F5J12DRAFT_784753 [Pisolithus orientalis]